MNVELARLDVLLREATYDINNMLQQSTHWDTEILMQEVKEQWEESSPMCGTHLEPPSQEHVDEKECSNELQQRIAMAMIGEHGQSNMTTLSEAEKSNASTNSEESDAKNDITTLLLKHESVNYSYQHLPQQSSAARKSLLMEMIEKYEEISGCMLENFKRDGPSFGLHKILEEDCYSNCREQQLPQQRRLHPTKMEDDKNELDCWKIPTLMALDEDVPAKPRDGGTRTIAAARLTLKGVLAERTIKQLDEVYMPWQCCPQQEPSNSMDVELARLDVLLREATYDINNMLQQSTHWDTEILMQEVKEQWEESSPMCGTHLEPPSQEHVDEKECSNELQQRIAMAMIGEPGQSNMTTLSEAEKSNASANSEESDAKNDITTLLLKHEFVNYSYQNLPQQSYDDMLGQQDGGALLMEYEEPSKFWYDCLGDDTLYMVIPSDSSAARKSLLMEMIEKSEEISGCMLENFKRDGPSFGLHRILEEDCYSNCREQQLPQQRRLHPTKMEDDKNELDCWKIPTLMALDEDVPAKPPDGGTRTIAAARLTLKGVLAERTIKHFISGRTGGQNEEKTKTEDILQPTCDTPSASCPTHVKEYSFHL
ncbi:hypothetical protein GQ457_12G014960 [Hibiscus cannabinus]